MRSTRRQGQSGQVLVIVAVALLALIGSAALILLAGSVEWQKDQLQELADATALDSALKIGISCDGPKADIVIKEADAFLGTRRTHSTALGARVGACATSYTAMAKFDGGLLTATYNYPYRAHQQQVEVILTLNLPISFGVELGKTSTPVTRRAVAQQLAGSVPAISATALSCTGGQVNVAGSIVAQNLITRAGGCAFYAHTRFDPASGTYSDLGNALVYTDAQGWTGIGGACVATSNTGSANAICADGYEESGHVAPACGTTGTSAFLSLGARAVDPNPCAVGVATPPVPPRPATLPPDPNADPAIFATLPGGVPCSAAGAYPNIVVGGVTVANGLAPVPIKDPSGYYHFKPSCYGFINTASLSGISNVQTGAETPDARHFITMTMPAASQVGTLLVAEIHTEAPVGSISLAGWVLAVTVTGPSGRSDIWYRASNPGGIATATFTVLPAAIDAVAQMSEWRNAAIAPLDRVGTSVVAINQPTASITAVGANTVANELVITNDGFTPKAGQAITQGASWNSVTKDVESGFGSEFRLDLGTVVASETVASSVPTTWGLAIATFKPAPGGNVGAVLDPGFYYFNGSGFAGGGGICLNGGKLMGRDVTMEFVRGAGFSSGTCAPGGGAANCSAPCQFGSTPCSISPCPPNVPADPPNNLTWLAAPCTTVPPGAPAGDAASCLGAASWCPAGDRSCQNLLIYQAAGVINIGQIAIKGPAVNAWMLGSIYWSGTCTDAVNGTSTIAGSLACGSISMSAAAGAGIGVGSDYGINTATVEAILVE